MSLSSEQMTELVDIREQFVSRHFDKKVAEWMTLEIQPDLTDEQVNEWRNEGYREFRRLYPNLNNAFAPHLPEHLDEEGT